MKVLSSIAVIAILLHGGAPDAKAQSPVRVVPQSIDASGKSDVTVALGRFLNSLGEGDTVQLARRGRYRVDGTVVVRDRRGLTIDGNGATLVPGTEGDRERSQLTIHGGSDVIIRNLVVRGANPHGGLGEQAYRADREAQHGINIEGVQRVELDRVTVLDVYGDFVYIGRGAPGTFSEDVWIHDSVFARNGRQGIAVSSGRNIVIERNSIGTTRRATFDLEPNSPSGGVENVHILNNRIGPGRLLFVAAHGAGPVNDVVVSGNVLHGRPLGIDVKPPGSVHRKGFFIINNRSDTPAQRGPMRFIRVDSLVVRNNRQAVPRRGEVGVETRDVCGMLITGNNFGPSAKAVKKITTCNESRPLIAPPTPSIVVGADRRSGTPGTTTPKKTNPSERKNPPTSAPRAGTSTASPNLSDPSPVGPIVTIAAAIALLIAGAYALRSRLT